MAKIIEILGVSGSAPNFTLDVDSSTGVTASDHVTDNNGNIYRVATVVDPTTLAIVDDVPPDAPEGTPVTGTGSAYTPTSTANLSQAPFTTPAWDEIIRRDLRAIDDFLQTVQGTFSEPVADVTSLAALGAADRADRMLRLSEDGGTYGAGSGVIYYFDEQSAAVDTDGPAPISDDTDGVIIPNDNPATGRWIAIWKQGVQHEGLSGLQGGAANNRYHLTQAQHDAVTPITGLASSSSPDISDSTPVVGTSTEVARQDHVHAHGNRDGGTLHAEATDTVAGFMSAADKVFLDSLVSGTFAIDVRNETGSTIVKGKLVAVVGYSIANSRYLIDLADKDTPALRPAIGVASEDILDDENSSVVIIGTIVGVDTSSFSLTDQLVLGNNGNFVRPPPDNSPFTGEVQLIGSVTRVDALLGEVIVDASQGLLPTTAAQTFALEGTSGTPSDTNRYVTNVDPRVPTQSENDALQGTSGVPSSTNKFITSQDPRVPTQDENDALQGTSGAPSGSNQYVTDTDPRNSDSRNPTGAASGQLGGTYPGPDVRGLRETGGPTLLTMGAVADGEALSRSGSSIVGLDVPDLAAAAPEDVDKSAASAGISTEAARADHKHDVATGGATSEINSNDPASEGSSTNLAREDHVHSVKTDAAGGGGALSTVNAGDAADEGVGDALARRDHQHAVATAVPTGTVEIGDLGVEGTSTNLARADHVHPVGTPGDPANVTKATATAGTSAVPARADHKHDVSTASAVGLDAGSVNSEGSATSLARSDHTHDINVSDGAISTINAGDSTSEGTGDGFSRRDHQHAVATGGLITQTRADNVTAEGTSTNLAREDHVHAIKLDEPLGGGAISTIEAGDAAAEGSGAAISRRDHQHAVATGTPSGTVQLGDAGAEGTSLNLARADHVHPVGTPAAPVDVTKAVAAAGTSVVPARADHKHDVSTASPAASVDAGDAAAEGSATSLARSDHQHAVSTGAPGATSVGTTPSAGTSTDLARADHVHQSNTAPVNVTKAAAAIGTSGEPARADHKHDVSTAAPTTAIGTGTVNGEGSATTLARSDHSHKVNIPTQQVSSTSNFTTSSVTDVLITGMTITPGAGDYLVLFSGQVTGDGGAKQGIFSIYANGVQIPHSLREQNDTKDQTASTQAYVTGLGAGQAIEVRGRGNDTLIVDQRSLIVMRVG